MEFILGDAIKGLVGGLLIGCSAAILLLANGRIAGISGIAGALITKSATKLRFENLAFVLGLITAPLAYSVLIEQPEIGVSTNPIMLVFAGLCVGLGTRLGSGCTSGHGVCGLSRFSPRSLASVLTFVGTAMLVASGVRMITGAPV